MYALSPETLIKAYALGIFPMAQTSDDEDIFFIDPEIRCLIPLEAKNIPRRLKRTLRKSPYEVTINQAFTEVVDGCRERTDKREETWINPQIRQLYCALHRLGFGYSVECWQGENLVGGLYGVALAGAFFGESMFSRERDASKIALVHLMAYLKAGGFTLLDAQFSNPHLLQFGAIEVSRDEFKEKLACALATDARFPLDTEEDATQILHAFLQTNTDKS